MESIKKIDARIAELNEQFKAELAIGNRVMEGVAKYYAGTTKEKAPESPPPEMERRMEEAAKLLQLHPAEVKLLESEFRASRIINPCYLPTHSPDSRCSYTAADMDCIQWKAGIATTSCTYTKAQLANDINAKCRAYGYGSGNSAGTSYALVQAWAWFEITPPYPTPRFVTVNPKINFNGFYVLNSANVSLYASARGYQYDYNWGGKDEWVINQAGTGMSRFDNPRWLTFQMPVGADPFQVLVFVQLLATARGEGSSADIDFSTGAGNAIRIVYVNTWG